MADHHRHKTTAEQQVLRVQASTLRLRIDAQNKKFSGMLQTLQGAQQETAAIQQEADVFHDAIEQLINRVYRAEDERDAAIAKTAALEAENATLREELALARGAAPA